MKTIEISKHVEEWIRRVGFPSGDGHPEHCRKLRRDVTLPGAPKIDFVSVRHAVPAWPHAPHLFSVDLWMLVGGAIGEDTVRDMGLALLLFRAGYARILEDAQFRGLRRRHRVTIEGNLLGASVEPGSAVETLSGGRGELTFWTYHDSREGLRIEPHYVEPRTDRSARVLSTLLSHLPWESAYDPVAERGETLAAGGVAEGQRR